METQGFEELVGSETLRHAVRALGWTTPTPIQTKAIPLIRDGGDVVGIAQTGTGKTGAFLLPTLERFEGSEGLRMLVLCPTRELAQQVAHDARELAQQAGLWVVEIVGGMPMKPQIRDLKAHPDLVVATPGRLIDHVGRGNVDLSSIQTLVLDEADRMLDMGFRPQIDEILRTVPNKRQTLLFSATMPNGVHALALRILKDPTWVSVSPERVAAETVEQVVYPVRPERKAELVVELLDNNPDMDQVLVFTRTKIGADRLGTTLERAGVSVSVMHGDRNMRQRMKALDAFAEGHTRVLVATDVAQRGLDIEGISHVINYDVPQDPEDYVHRIGRTGRAGAKGDAITLMTGADLALVRSIEQTLGYVLKRVSLPEFDYPHGGGAATQERTPEVRTNRTGSRLGSRKASELSEDELKALLNVG